MLFCSLFQRGMYLDLSRFSAAPGARLSHLSFRRRAHCRPWSIVPHPTHCAVTSRSSEEADRLQSPATCELAYLGSLRAARMTVLSAALRRRRLRICREIRAARARSEKIEFTERARSPNSRRPTRTSPAEARMSRDRQGRRKIKSLAFVPNGWSRSARKQGCAALALGSSEPIVTFAASRLNWCNAR